MTFRTYVRGTDSSRLLNEQYGGINFYLQRKNEEKTERKRRFLSWKQLSQSEQQSLY